MVRPIPADRTRALRHELLRPGQSAAALVYAGDDHPDGRHFGAFDAEDRLVGIATIYPEPPPREFRGLIPEVAFERGSAFRLRGMATLPDVRGAGYGRALIDACLHHIRQSDGYYLWCNARVVALDFYRAMGMETFGEEFDVPPIGPHYVMGREA